MSGPGSGRIHDPCHSFGAKRTLPWMNIFLGGPPAFLVWDLIASCHKNCADLLLTGGDKMGPHICNSALSFTL
jgi:hypothetical protein